MDVSKGSKTGELLRSPWTKYGVGPGILLSATFAPSPLSLIAAAVGTALVESAAFAADRQEARRRAELEVANARLAISNHLDACVTGLEVAHNSASATFRANVMLIEDDVLTIAFSTPGYTKEELEMEWRRGEGTAGHAWDRAKTQVAPKPGHPLPEAAHANDVNRPWGMTSKQITSTCHIVKWVISVPIVKDSPQRDVVAVFNLDDSEPPSPAYIGSVPRAAEEFAEQLAPAIEQLLQNRP